MDDLKTKAAREVRQFNQSNQSSQNAKSNKQSPEQYINTIIAQMMVDFKILPMERVDDDSVSVQEFNKWVRRTYASNPKSKTGSVSETIILGVQNAWKAYGVSRLKETALKEQRKAEQANYQELISAKDNASSAQFSDLSTITMGQLFVASMKSKTPHYLFRTDFANDALWKEIIQLRIEMHHYFNAEEIIDDPQINVICEDQPTTVVAYDPSIHTLPKDGPTNIIAIEFFTEALNSAIEGYDVDSAVNTGFYLYPVPKGDRKQHFATIFETDLNDLAIRVSQLSTKEQPTHLAYLVATKPISSQELKESLDPKLNSGRFLMATEGMVIPRFTKQTNFQVVDPDWLDAALVIGAHANEDAVCIGTLFVKGRDHWQGASEYFGAK